MVRVQYVLKQYNGALGDEEFHFNVCGYATQSCYTTNWVNPHPTGVAVQTWGTTPSCATKDCEAPNGDAVCCTSPCATLGIGEPSFDVRNVQSPKTGGINITHVAVPPDDQDPTEYVSRVLPQAKGA